MSKVVQQKAASPAAPNYKAFDDFIAMGDLLAEESRRLKKQIQKAEQEAKHSPRLALETIKEGLKSLGFFTGVFPDESLRDYNAFFDRYYDWDEDNYEAILRQEVSKAVTLLLGSFPNTSNIPDPKVYTRMMIEEILAAETSMIAVESACREIRRKATFAPPIGEVLTILEKHAREHLQQALAVNEFRLLHKKSLALAATLEQQLNPQLQHKPVETLVVGVPLPVAATSERNPDND